MQIPTLNITPKVTASEENERQLKGIPIVNGFYSSLSVTLKICKYPH